jgi:5-dehydro-4-deoxyglucarate dehydratase
MSRGDGFPGLRFDGVLFFPVTPFDGAGHVDTALLARHVDEGVRAGAGAVFAACGTGEFASLDPDEHAAVTRETVAAVAGRVPVFAGVGGVARAARAAAERAMSAGASGVLLLPPYLSEARGEDLLRYVESATADGPPTIVYHRATARFDEESAVAVSRLPHVVGLKDGVGDIDLIARIVRAVRDDGRDGFHFFNGLPTAEVSQRAYRAVGVPSYSSAVFAFAPDLASAYHAALERGDDATLDDLDRSFFHPFVRLRSEAPGYAVSLVKAGVALGGLPVGAARPPLPVVRPDHLATLDGLLSSARAHLAAGAET